MKIRGAAASYRAASLAAALLAAACGDGGGGSPPSTQNPPLGVQRVFPVLVFAQPVALLQAPRDPTRWFVVEQAGTVRVFANTAQVASVATFIDITDRVTSGGEMGLLGMAFHPDFPSNPRVYLNYTNESASGRVSRISEFRLGAAADLDPSTERILLTIGQPEANHNGGNMLFGRDRFLYIGMGDGGGANDQHGAIGNGQVTATLLGKMLRIDVSPASGYAIPTGVTGNPFSGNPPCGAGGTGAQSCPEIYALGFRNPWRWSFDRTTDDLWVADVGQGAIEEVDRVALGGNYGWRCFEGTRPTGLQCGAAANLQPPVAEYDHSEGASVTGGFVYRGTAIAGLQGRYVFADFVSGRLWHIAVDTQPTLRVTGGTPTGLNISSFGEDVAGELYVLDHSGGGIYRVTAQ